MQTCDKCGKVYADKFNSCPNCKGKKFGKGCLIAVALVLGVGVIASLFPGDNKNAPTSTSLETAKPQFVNEDLNQCVNREVRTGQYNSLDGGKSAMAIMAACEEPLIKKMPACFADDPKDNEIDNQKQMSPGASCRLAAVAAIQLTLKAHEGGIPLSDESTPGKVKAPAQSSAPQQNTAPAPDNQLPTGSAPEAPVHSANQGDGVRESNAAPAGLPPGAASGGPSFDCTRVTSQVLALICRTPALAAADRQLAAAYWAARARSTTPGELVRDQRQWMQDRADSPADVPFLMRMYRDRIDYLNAP